MAIGKLFCTYPRLTTVLPLYTWERAVRKHYGSTLKSENVPVAHLTSWRAMVARQRHVGDAQCHAFCVLVRLYYIGTALFYPRLFLHKWKTLLQEINAGLHLSALAPYDRRVRFIKRRSLK